MRSFAELYNYRHCSINEYWLQANRALENGATAGQYPNVSDAKKEEFIKEFIFLKACRIPNYRLKTDDLVILYEQLNTPGSRHDRIAKAIATSGIFSSFTRGEELDSPYIADILLKSVQDGLPRGNDKEIEGYIETIKKGQDALEGLQAKRRATGRKVPARKKPTYKIFSDNDIQEYEASNQKELTDRIGMVTLDAKFALFNEKMLTEINKLIVDSEAREKKKDNISGSYTDFVNAAKKYKEALLNNESPAKLNGLLLDLEVKASLYEAGHSGIRKGNGPKGRMRYNASVNIGKLLTKEYKDFADSFNAEFGKSVVEAGEKGCYDYIKDELTKTEHVFAKSQAMKSANKNYTDAINDLKKRCFKELRNEYGNVYNLPEKDFTEQQRKKVAELVARAIVIEANKEKAREYIGLTDKKNFYNSLALADETFSNSVMETLVGDIMQRDAFKAMIKENTNTMADITKLGEHIKKGNFTHCYLEYNKAVEKENAQLKKEKEKKKEKERVREMEKPDKLKLPGLGI